MANLLLSSSSIGLRLVSQDRQLRLGVAENVGVGNVYNVTQEKVVGSFFVVEPVMHGVEATLSFGQLWIPETTLNQAGLIPTKDTISGWMPWDLLCIALAGTMKGKTLLHLRRFMLNNAGWAVNTQSTLRSNLSGVGQIVTEANEV